MRISLFFICFTSILSLLGCSLPGTQDETTGTTPTENTFLYQTDTISMLLPKSWTGVRATDIPSPRVGEIVTASKSTDAKYGFASNILILRDRLETLVTSTKYSEINHLQTTKNYLEYTKLRDEAFQFSDSETSRLYVFEARYNETTPRMKFIQVARVCGSDVYLIHVSLTLDKSPDNYIELLRTFRCK